LNTVSLLSNTLEKETREGIVKGNKTFYANKTLFKTKLVSRKFQLKLHRLVIILIVVYGFETWVLKESIIQGLSVFERKILRKIFGPTKISTVFGELKQTRSWIN
jgi:hypothetical protein